MAQWLEDIEDERTKVIVESNGMSLVRVMGGGKVKRR